jgi:hypothetical protein
VDIDLEFWEQRLIRQEEYRLEIIERWKDIENKLDRLTEVTASMMGVYYNIEQEIANYNVIL